jgi:hypothetical protein
MVLIVVSDLSISNLHLKGMPYKELIFSQFALLIFLFGLIRLKRRWQGMSDMKKFKKFSFVSEIAKTHRLQGSLVTAIEVLFFTAVILFCLLYINLNPEYVLPMIAAVSFIIIESILFFVRIYGGGNAFRVGVNKDVVAYFDREMHLYYFTGLRKVELYQSDLITFTYRDELNLSFPTNSIPKDKRVDFRNTLIEILEEKNVYIDDSLRNWQ